MKINNPVKFTKGSDANSADNELASIGDVKKICGDSKNFSIFMQQFSADGTDENGWHSEQTSDDKFVRYSFDGGVNWQIRSSYQGDTFILKNSNDHLFNFNYDFPLGDQNINGSILLAGDSGDAAILGAILSSIISNETSNIPSDIINNGVIYDFVQTGIIDKVTLVKQSGDPNQTITLYSYIEDSDVAFNIVKDNNNGGNLKLQYYYSKKASDINSFFVKVKLNRINNFVIGSKINVPVYSSFESAIPTVSDEVYGTCNYLSKTNSSLTNITLLSRFVNIKRICLYVVSMDGNIGNVSLNVKFGQNEVDKVINVSSIENWVYIENTQNSSGEIIITRVSDNNDTLNDICIVTGIRVETE